MKNFCEYELIDFNTGLVFVVGQKHKHFKHKSFYTYLGSFKQRAFTSNTISCFVRPIYVMNRFCLLVYYVHSKPSEKLILLNDNIVTGVGEMLGLRGKQYVTFFDVSLDIVEKYKQIEKSRIE